MSATGLRVFLVLVTVVFLLGLGYAGWQTQSIMRSLDRIASRQQEPVKRPPAPSRLTEEEIKKIAGQIRLPGAEELARAVEKPLIARVQSAVAESQRQAVGQALQKWSDAARQRDEKQWRAVTEQLREEREETRKRLEKSEQRLQELVAAFRQEREASEKKYQQERQAAEKRQRQEEERWQKLLTVIRQEREENRKQFAEIVRRLDEERAAALERARQLEEERDREIARRLKQAEQIEQERKRLIAEFCVKRPDSPLCRDL